jgi:hypothetical protein
VTDIPQGLVTFTNTADNQGQLAQLPLDANGTATLPASVKLCCYINTIVAAYGGEDRFQSSTARLTVYDLTARPRARPGPPTPPTTRPRPSPGFDIGRFLSSIAQRLQPVTGRRP